MKTVVEVSLESQTVKALDEAAAVLGLDGSDLVGWIVEGEVRRKLQSPNYGFLLLRSIFNSMEFETLPEAEAVMDRIQEYEKARGLDVGALKFLMHRTPEGRYAVDDEALRRQCEEMKAETERLREKSKRLKDRMREDGELG